MILIDKAKTVQNIILTLTEITSIEDAKYLLVLKNDATRAAFKLFLPENLSDSPTRYDLFLLETTVFDGLGLGYYTYSIYQAESDASVDDEVSEDDLLDTGKALIKDLTPVSTEDQYIVYNI